MEHSVKHYYSKPPSERTVKLLDLITENLAKNGLELSPAMAFGKKYGTRQLQKILSVEDD